MRKKNGFISMSIIYSFFTVFILVSTSLLLIYSNNLAIVKSVNKEIKEDLTTKGNKSLMVFQNLIADGSFEKVSENWKIRPDTPPPVFNEQKYYGSYSLGFVQNSTYSYVQSINTIDLIKDHYYYISRIYLAFNNIPSSSLTFKLIPATNGDFSDANGFDILENAYGIMASSSCTTTSTDTDCLYGNRSINKERIRYQSGFCLGINGRCNPDESEAEASQTTANTFESGIFKYTEPNKTYKILLGADYTGHDLGTGISPRYYTDGYMLIDLTVALQLNEEKTNKLFNGQDNTNGYRIGAGKIDELLDGRFIEDQKIIPINKLELE